MPTIALCAFALLVCWLLALDVKREKGVLSGTWCVVAWFILISSRPLSSIFGVDLGSGGAAEAYDEGGPIDRGAYLFLMGWGLAVLYRRGVSLGQFAKSNQLLFLFFLYWALSILWADAPFIALKRWVKDIGNIVMVLVLLSDPEPGRAIRALFKRTAAILVPISVLLIRFVPELGRTFHSGTGEMMYTGVTTHKNSLGMLAFVYLLFLIWDLIRDQDKGVERSSRVNIGDFTLIFLTGSLLIDSGSATAMGAAIMGLAIVLIFTLRIARDHVGFVEFLALAVGIGLWLSNLTGELFEYLIVDVFGRDMTLTSRTDVWPLLLSKTDGVLFGSGFNSFWTGERLSEIYQNLGIIQAHNGYIETYLNGGVVAVVFLGLLLLGAIIRINRGLASGDPLARLAFAILATSVIYNFTEASFNKIGILWFVFLLMIVEYRELDPSGKNELAANEQVAGGIAGNNAFAQRVHR